MTVKSAPRYPHDLTPLLGQKERGTTERGLARLGHGHKSALPIQSLMIIICNVWNQFPGRARGE